MLLLPSAESSVHRAKTHPAKIHAPIAGLDFHYTPLHASWVNQVELWFGILHRRCLKNGSFPGVDALKREVEAFAALWNEKDKHPFKWTFAGYTTD